MFKHSPGALPWILVSLAIVDGWGCAEAWPSAAGKLARQDLPMSLTGCHPLVNNAE